MTTFMTVFQKNFKMKSTDGFHALHEKLVCDSSQNGIFSEDFLWIYKNVLEIWAQKSSEVTPLCTAFLRNNKGIGSCDRQTPRILVHAVDRLIQY